MKRAGQVHRTSVATLSNVHEPKLDVVTGDSRPVPTSAQLGELFRSHAQFIGRSLRRLGVPASDVEDAVQEVFVIVSRKMEMIAEGAERSFLYGTAMRVASNARRVDRRAQTRRSDEPVDETAVEIDPRPTAEEMIHQRQARATLDTVLETMSVEMRAVFTLFELEEMTTAEIASLLGVPVGTVSSRLWRAREHFDRQVRAMQAQQQETERMP
ncbi:MAG: polymerase sigma factor RpoE [Labilithrix sp.]|nr:polymerase sigma factor RpoE [Labilithrix sp.]